MNKTDREFIIGLQDEIEHNNLILLLCIPNDTVFSLEELWRINTNLKQQLEFKLQII